MKCITIALATTAVVVALPAAAQADRSDCSRKLERTYTAKWHKVRHVHGQRAPGRNIRRDGVRFRGVTFDATCGELRRSRRQLQRLLRRPAYPGLRTEAVPPPQPPGGVQTATVDGIYGQGGWAIPEDIVMCESGGNYGAVNPSSGAYGAYQILPSTSAALGCNMSTPAGQDECAAKVWATQGRGAWVC